MWQQQAFVLDSKFNAYRTSNHPNFSKFSIVIKSIEKCIMKSNSISFTVLAMILQSIIKYLLHITSYYLYNYEENAHLFVKN